MKATAIIPVKRLGQAKSRLAGGLSGERRRSLMTAMFTDTITAVRRSRQIGETIVVTGDPQVERIAKANRATVITDPPEAGHSEAALLGIAQTAAETVILLPGDCPLLDPREVDRLLTGLPHPFVTVVPDRHGSGTNALVLSPADAIRPAFGEGSCERHVAAARAAGIPYAVEPAESLGLDLDTPADLVALARAFEAGVDRDRGRQTARVLGL